MPTKTKQAPAAPDVLPVTQRVWVFKREKLGAGALNYHCCNHRTFKPHKVCVKPCGLVPKTNTADLLQKTLADAIADYCTAQSLALPLAVAILDEFNMVVDGFDLPEPK